MTRNSLEKAAQAAVDASTAEMSKIVARAGRLTDLLRESASEVRSLGLGKGEDDPAVRLAGQLDETLAKVGDLFERQSAALQTFNIVLFGRTGAGKSTLISAMTRGNGASVSQGESDWTTQVAPLDWYSCRIYDTPGINGWGRTENRSDLEARAREAVEVADFVLVCFDSQSQQADEFTKLAAWVQNYRKPLIAVLNPRNARWRLPPRVLVGSARSNLSRAVREHADNIGDELAKIGLFGVPVVVVSLKRALFARASLPFLGPDELSLQNQRAEYGVEQLESWSGFARFENLLVQAISDHAVPLRLGALNDQLRGVLSELDDRLDEIEREARQAAETIEKDLVGTLLRLLGYPPREEKERRRPLMSGDRDLLSELEQRRNGAFQAPVEGEFRQLVRQRLDAELGSLRSRSLQNAEECVVGAFERGLNLSADTVRSTSFDEAEMQHAAERVLIEGAEFLQKRTDLAHRDTKLELKVLTRGAVVQGNAGAGWKYSSWAIKGGGILVGAASILGFPEGTENGNPPDSKPADDVHVAKLVAALVLSLTASGLGWLGGKAWEKGEKKHLVARHQDLAEVRRTVHEVYDSFRDEVLSQAHKQAVAASGELLKPPIEQALLLRHVQHHCAMLRAEIDRLIGDLPQTVDPQALLFSTASDIEVAAYPKDANRSRLYWLGEDWIEDPIGLEHVEGTSETGHTSAYDPGFFDRLFEGLKGTFDRVTKDLKPGSGREWLNGALERCPGDPVALEALAELEEIAADGRPRIHLVGDYNAGKSSFIMRLLLEVGSPVPPDLEIRANPTTDRPHEYDWDGVRLIDSPGFQSGEATHTEYALRSFPDASAVIYLFQPNLVLGDDGHLITVLQGDRELGLVPKQECTFFVVNRSDELGVDPETNPDAYRQLADRKKTELSLALDSRGISVDPDAVFCMASDPFGLVGNRSDVDAKAFDPYRAWDGFGHFIAEFRRARGLLLRAGADRSVLEGGIARLSRLEARQTAGIDQLTHHDSSIGRLQMQINEVISEGARLGGKHRADLERLVTEHAAGFRDEVLAEEDPEQLKLKADRLAQWWNDEALQVEILQWAKKAAEELNAWRERSSEAIERRLESTEFRAAFGNHTESAPDIPDAKKGKSWFREAFDKGGRVTSGATRDNVYKIGKALGFNFKPWGAVKLAKKLRKVGAVMGVVGVGADIADIFLAERRSAKREEDRQKIAAFLRESVPRFVETVAQGSEEEPGVLRHLEVATQVLRDHEAELSKERERLATQLGDARERLTTYSALRTEACALLGNPWR
jgi:predicted GTPase